MHGAESGGAGTLDSAATSSVYDRLPGGLYLPGMLDKWEVFALARRPRSSSRKCASLFLDLELATWKGQREAYTALPNRSLREFIRESYCAPWEVRSCSTSLYGLRKRLEHWKQVVACRIRWAARCSGSLVFRK